MTRNQLFTSLNKLCKELSDKYNINCGGCCYVAACLAQNLENAHIPFTVIHYDVFHCHYAIKVSDRYINRDDYPKNEIYEVLEISSSRLFDIYYENDWNCEYDTKNNSKVSSRINSLFRKYANRRT